MFFNGLLARKGLGFFVAIWEWTKDYPWTMGMIFMMASGGLMGWAVHGFYNKRTTDSEDRVISGEAAVGLSWLRMIIGWCLFSFGAYLILTK